MRRRTFLAGAAGLAGGTRRIIRGGIPTASDWRAAFPALSQTINGHPLIYLDSAATTLRPRPVIEAVSAYSGGPNANPGAALHTLARRAAAALEGARTTVAEFIGAADPLEVTFTRGTTEGLNLVADTWGTANVGPADEILIGVAEHASNLLPWRNLAHRTGARLIQFATDADGAPSLEDFKAKLSARTRVVAFSQVSNVLGLINPVRELCDCARSPGRIVVVDGAQSAPHLAVDVRELGCDFFAFSGHKMLGPMGVGVLWGRRTLLDDMPPYQCGSNMAHDADFDGEHLAEGSLKYGAGTPNVAGAVGLAAAIAFIRQIGRTALHEHQRAIVRRMTDRLRSLPAVRLLGAADPIRRVGVFTFTVAGPTPAEVVSRLDDSGIAIRAGDLAALPLLRRFGLSTAARASCYLYNTVTDVDRFADALERAAR